MSDTVYFIDPDTLEWKEEKRKEIKLSSKYFKPTTGMSYYDSIVEYPEYHRASKGMKGQIKLIKPEEYFFESAKSRTKPTSPSEEQIGVHMPLVEEYVERSRKGEKMPIPVIDMAHHAQEGRHRAMVSKQLGLKKIPVLFIEETK